LRSANWQSAGGNKATTVIKTFALFSFVTPPKTPPHKSLSKKNFSGALKARTLPFALKAPLKILLTNLAQENKNKNHKKTKSWLLIR